MKTVVLSLFGYAFFCLSLLSLPDNVWDFLILYSPLIRSSFQQLLRRLPLIGAFREGEALKAKFIDCEASLTLGLNAFPKSLPKYKFYTHLIEQLVAVHRSKGVGLKKIFPEIRNHLIRDVQFERKIVSEIISGLLQFMIIFLTTWGFVYLSISLVELPPNHIIFFFMFLLQLIGSLLFFLLIHFLKKNIFEQFAKALEEAYLFSVLLEIGVPINEILERSQIQCGLFSQSKMFSSLSVRMKNLIKRLKQTGISPLDESKEIIAELWQFQEDEFLQFTKKLQVLKFFILAFFFLPSYFLYLYSIFQFFMEH